MRFAVESDGGDDRRVRAQRTMRPRLSQRRSRLRRRCVLEAHNALARSRKSHIPYPGSPSAGGKQHDFENGFVILEVIKAVAARWDNAAASVARNRSDVVWKGFVPGSF